MAEIGPILFAYDGSELAQLAIEQAGRQLAPEREALVLCVWQPVDLGFVPLSKDHLDATDAKQVLECAAETAAHGAALAVAGGFRAEPLTVECAPSWKAIVKTAEERGASLIVLGSHQHSGLGGRLLGSVAAAVLAHTATAVLIIHQPC